MAKIRVPRTRAGETWTEARYFSFIRGALRQASRRWPVKFQVKVAARDGKRGLYRYLCNHCGLKFKDKEVEVDHIVGAGSLNTYQDLPAFVERLFCEEDNLQVLCKPCHLVKTNAEKKKK